MVDRYNREQKEAGELMKGWIDRGIPMYVMLGLLDGLKQYMGAKAYEERKGKF